jgi:hypothetical protein
MGEVTSRRMHRCGKTGGRTDGRTDACVAGLMDGWIGR